MSEYNVPFTDEDHRILSSCVTLVEGLADYLGGGYEIVLHSLEDVEHSVVKIINGHHTGRTTGAPITDLALSMLSRIENENRPGYISYFSRNKRESRSRLPPSPSAAWAGVSSGCCASIFTSTRRFRIFWIRCALPHSRALR